MLKLFPASPRKHATYRRSQGTRRNGAYQGLVRILGRSPMRTHSAASLPRSLRRLVLIGIAFSLTALTTLVLSPDLCLSLCFGQNASTARNPERLHLLLDSTKVLGWIS